MNVRIDNLSVGYGSGSSAVTVAGGLCGEICSGRLTCLLGANGVGKSTLLRTLAAFQPRLGGSITIGGREASAFTQAEMARTVGVVLTEKPDISNMSVRETVCLGRSPYTGFWGRCGDADLAVVDEALAMTGLTPLAGRSIGTLSDGERQKVMIAKALAQQTPVIILDEPTAFLDYPSKVETMRLLRRIAREADKAVFMSTHDLELALQTADTVWLMARGRGIIAGPPGVLVADGSIDVLFAGHDISFGDVARGVNVYV